MKTLVLQTHALNVSYLGCYGNEWVATPNIDRLASEGIVFDQHYANCPTEACGDELRLSVRSAFAGNFQEIRGLARIERACAKLADAGHWLLWAQLPSLAPPWKVPRDTLELYFQDEGEDAPSPWLDPPVGPLENPDDLERLQDTYGAVVTHFDTQIGELREKLEAWDEITIVLTASSGLALGEHGVVGSHRAWMHEEVWHVPLLIRLPHGEEAGRRVGALTQPDDLKEWLLSPSNECGIGSLIHGERKPLREFVTGKLRIGSSEEWALRTPEWAFLLPVEVPADDSPRMPRLYVKPDDRWEVNDVSQHHSELVESLSERLRGASAKPQAAS